MKIKLDENLPERLMAELAALGHDVDTVRLEQPTGRDDGDVWRATQAAGRFFITQDLDFSDWRRYAPGRMLAFLSCASRSQVVRRYSPGCLCSLRRRRSRHGEDAWSSQPTTKSA